MRAERLIHGAVYVLVFKPQGELFVQKRTFTKDISPGYHDVADEVLGINQRQTNR